jgi:hypothetical protein
MLESAFHLAGLDCGDLFPVQILCPIDPAIAGDRLVRFGWSGGLARRHT